MGIAISNLAPDDPRIRKVRGSCGCVIQTTTNRYPAIVRGEKVYIDCLACQRAVRVTPFENPETRFCSSPECRHPKVPLSRYNGDPEGRCNACEVRDRERLLERLSNPFHATRDRVLELLEEHRELTPVQLGEMTRIPVKQIYATLQKLANEGVVERIRERKMLVRYRLLEQMAVAA